MVSALQASLLLTFAVATMAQAPAPSPSPSVGLDVTSEKLLHFGKSTECWDAIRGLNGCAEHFLRSVEEENIKFLPECCKALVGLPADCFDGIFPDSILFSFADKAHKLCDSLPGGDSLPRS